MDENVIVKSFGEVLPKASLNARTPYQHQRNAMENLDIINKESSYRTLIVLPTGGGKTYTASLWLLKNAIDKKKKILWIAHRQMLLDQAAESFQKYAFSENMPHISSFNYRIISGSSNHERVIDIKKDDNLLIMSKDSIGRNLDGLKSWLDDEEEIFLVVDEAHHSTAKTYRKVIDYVHDKVDKVKLIGLTATPFRTAIEEQGLLAKIYSDGIQNGSVRKNNIGISYQISLKELIARQILSKPIFESHFSEEYFGESLGVDAWDSIQNLDILPEKIANQIAENALRNKLIVDVYKDNAEKYGQTIIFAVNVTHAIVLNSLFNKAGINSDFIVSDIKDAVTGISLSREDNERKIAAYRDKKLQVLINVNILTEGIDLPQTQSVFLARPTVSTILMTQMIGRTLRGVKAGGTSSAYIVSFIDNWNEHIAWVNPQSLFTGENEFDDNTVEQFKKELNMIAISKIEEFAAILDNTVDSAELEKVPFLQRVPVGMYAFTYLEENGLDLSYQVMVYDSTFDAYKELMGSLQSLFENMNINDEYLSSETINLLESQCRETFFYGEMIPPYQSDDVIHILKYFAQYEEPPKYYSFDEIDRNKLDLGKIAKNIRDLDMRRSEEESYINSLWDSQDDNMIRLFFGKKLYFINQLNIEQNKLSNPDLYEDKENIKYGTKKLEDMPLYEIGKYNPSYEKKLRNDTFSKFKTEDGKYYCAECGVENSSKVIFQVDHIIPMNKGGKSTLDNLQILCRQCNGIKGENM